jgi:murein DD-endopeptidase
MYQHIHHQAGLVLANVPVAAARRRYSLTTVRRALALLVVLLSVQLAACSNSVRWEESATALRSAPAEGQQVARVAKSMLGVPYLWGGAKPDGFDCSGLVQYSYNSAGLQVPRTSAAQFSASRRVDLSDARAGDLVFFSFKRKVSHVGIYLGGGRFVHAPSKGKRVEVASLTQPPYRNNFVAAGRMY